MSVYTWECHYDNLRLGTPLTVDATWDDTLPLGSVALVATFTRGTAQTIGVQIDLWAHHFGGTPTYEFVSMVKWGPNVLPLWLVAPPGSVAWQTEANGQNGALFRNNTRLQIDVDDVAFTATFSVDGYSTTQTFAALGIANGTVTATSLNSINLLMHPPKNTMDWQVEVDFYNFYLSKDGTRIKGAQLGSYDPGAWSVTPWANNSFGLPVATDNGIYSTQTTTRQGGGRTFDHLTQTDGQPYISAVWDNAGVPQLKDVEAVIDLICSPNSGALVYARVVREHVDGVTVGYSNDNGHTWTEVLVSAPGAYCTSPSLQVTPREQISLVFYDGQEAQWWLSDDFGVHWRSAGVFFAPLPWSPTTTHPKHFINPSEGSFLVTYNHLNHVFVQAFDVGTAAAPIGFADLGTVGSGFDAYPAIVTTSLNRITVFWVDGGPVNEWHNDTLGVGPWTNDLPAISSNDLRHDMVYREAAGQTWVVFQDAATMDLEAYSSSNPPDYTANGFTSLIQSAAIAQYAAIDVLPRGLPIIVYQNGLRQVVTKICVDAVQTWQLA